PLPCPSSTSLRIDPRVIEPQNALPNRRYVVHAGLGDDAVDRLHAQHDRHLPGHFPGEVAVGLLALGEVEGAATGLDRRIDLRAVDLGDIAATLGIEPLVDLEIGIWVICHFPPGDIIVAAHHWIDVGRPALDVLDLGLYSHLLPEALIELRRDGERRGRL